MKAKQILVLALICIFSTSLFAQEVTEEISIEQAPVENLVVANHEVSVDFQRRHDLDINFGVPSFIGTTMSVIVVPLLAVANNNNFDMDFTYIGLYGINYHYQYLKWLKFGAKVSYEGYKTNYFQKNSTVFDHKDVTSIISITPSLQFTYLNREHVQLYSGIDIGCMMMILNKEVAAIPLGNITPIGICWGGDVYGLFEVNIGCDAIAKIGIGYHIKN